MTTVKLTCQWHSDGLIGPLTISQYFNCDCTENGPLKCGVCLNPAKYYVQNRSKNQIPVCQTCYNAKLRYPYI
jgi:hypothetical protein